MITTVTNLILDPINQLQNFHHKNMIVLPNNRLKSSWMLASSLHTNVIIFFLFTTGVCPLIEKASTSIKKPWSLESLSPCNDQKEKRKRKRRD